MPEQLRIKIPNLAMHQERVYEYSNVFNIGFCGDLVQLENLFSKNPAGTRRRELTYMQVFSDWQHVKYF